MVDIFKEAKENTVPTWAKFEKAGDKIQGTYIGKIVGQIDGYGNKQTIYQLLQDDGSVVNAGFGLNKKVLHRDMDLVKFGQIVGIIFKGRIKVKGRLGKETEVNDFGLHQDSKIVDVKWLKENKDNMPEIIYVDEENNSIRQSAIDAQKNFDEIGRDIDNTVHEETPFGDKSTDARKLIEIERLAKEKLGTVEIEATKTAIMTKLGIAFIPINYSEIIEALIKM